VTWASDLRGDRRDRRAHGTEVHRCPHARGFAFIRIVLAEFGRAVAAERRYDDLMRTGTERPHAARRVFLEFYS
jgi:hypothetical protein